jgi:hypothetical protein
MLAPVDGLWTPLSCWLGMQGVNHWALRWLESTINLYCYAVGQVIDKWLIAVHGIIVLTHLSPLPYSLLHSAAGYDATKACVRQPWHDIHARVEGPVAMDICLNFMERW